MVYRISNMDRDNVLQRNRAVRTIKNELEYLLASGAIADEDYDQIVLRLPLELPLSSTAAVQNAAAATATTAPAIAKSLRLPPNSHSFTTNKLTPTSTSATLSPTPALALAPSKPTSSRQPIARATALYNYVAYDTLDCALTRGDHISVFEHRNDDWWMGRNERTGAEGLFPSSYVQVVTAADAAKGDKAAEEAGSHAQQQYWTPPPPAYGVTAGGTGGGDSGGIGATATTATEATTMTSTAGTGGGTMVQSSAGSTELAGDSAGKKLGKKLGNAAIFGAGATMGSSLVHSLF